MYDTMHQTPPPDFTPGTTPEGHDPSPPAQHDPMGTMGNYTDIEAPAPTKPVIAPFLIRLLLVILSVVAFALAVEDGMARNSDTCAFGIFHVFNFVWNFCVCVSVCVKPFLGRIPSVTFIVGERRVTICGPGQGEENNRRVLRSIVDGILVICLTITTGVGPGSSWRGSRQGMAGVSFMALGFQWCLLFLGLEGLIVAKLRDFRRGYIRLPTSDAGHISVVA